MDHPRLQELIDHHDIRQLLATYCHGCDRADEIEMASVYHEESWDDHGPLKAKGKPFSIQTVRDAIATTDLVSHLLGQSQIRVDGDSAGAETYFLATLLYPPKAPGEPQTIGQLGGRYVDRLVRQDGRWLIVDRVCIREWSHSHPAVGDWLATAGFVGQQRGGDDPSYRALGLTHAGNPWLAPADAEA